MKLEKATGTTLQKQERDATKQRPGMCGSLCSFSGPAISRAPAMELVPLDQYNDCHRAGEIVSYCDQYNWRLL